LGVQIHSQPNWYVFMSLHADWMPTTMPRVSKHTVWSNGSMEEPTNAL
jgi:hypothetical protein